MIDYDKEKLERIAKEEKLKLVVMFGSQARGDVHEYSDVDVAVVGEEKVDLSVLSGKFSECFTNVKVDLVDTLVANPLLLKQIADEGVVIVGSNDEFTELQLKAFLRYQDYKPYLDDEKAYILNKLGDFNVAS